MRHRQQRRAPRTALAAATTAVLAAGTLALPAAQAADPAAGASVVLDGADPRYDGVVAAWPGDADKDPANAATQVDGISCWETSGDPYVRYLYVDVDEAVIPEGETTAVVTVDYYDGGTTGMDLHYDSQSSPWTGTTNLELTGENTWKTHSWTLRNIRFDNRSNGADFRLNVKAEAGAMPPICFSRIQVDFGEPMDPLAVTSPSLVFVAGDGSVELSTPASSVDWVIGDENGAPLRSGTAAVADNAAAVDVSDLPPGYYTFEASSEHNGTPVTRRTSFGIVTPPPEGTGSPDNFFAVAMHYGWQRPEVESALLDTIARIGWGSTRSDANWGGIERESGVYDFASYAFDKGARAAAERGITSMPITGFRNPLYDGGKTPSTPEGLDAFAAFNAAVSANYADITDDISVYNEYNSTGFNDGACGITAACYLDMLTRAYAAIHDANPDANVVAATSAGTKLDWHQDFFERGGLDHLDAFSVNFYGYNDQGPGTPPEATTELAEFPQLVDMVEQHQGDRDIPIWVTENGWPTHTAGSTEAQQADHLIRAQVLIQAAGADKYFWYDAMDDGFDNGERENRFGLIRRPYDEGCFPAWVCGPGDSDQSIMGLAPKPAAISQAVLIRQVLGKEQQDREDIGDDAVYSFPYTGGETTRVLWATEPRTVQIEADQPVTVTDQFGETTEMTGHRGTITLEVEASPVFVTGAVTSITPVQPTISMRVPEQTVTDATVPVTVDIDRGLREPLPARLTVVVEGVTESVVARPGQTTSVTVDIPATTLTGERNVTALVASDDGPVVRLQESTTVLQPFDVSGKPHIEAGADGYGYHLDIAVTNNSSTEPLELSDLQWQVASWKGSVTEPLTVGPAQTRTFRVSVADATPFTAYPYTVTGESSTDTGSVSGQLSFAPIEPAGEQRLEPIALDDLGRWVGLRGGQHGGTADLSGTVQFTYTAGELILDAVINDDVHLADRDPAAMWQVDSVQFSTYAALPSVHGATRVEVGASLLDSGPETYGWAPAPGQTAGPVAGADVEVVRDDSAGTTAYTVAVPWSSLGFDGPPVDGFGLSFLVNDADAGSATDSRKGYYEWGSGIGAAPKDPSKFHSAQLVDLG